jgi:hypothetical protein
MAPESNMFLHDHENKPVVLVLALNQAQRLAAFRAGPTHQDEIIQIPSTDITQADPSRLISIVQNAMHLMPLPYS